MKILHTVEFYYPSIGGAQEVVKQISEHLVSMGHDVTVATSHLNRKSLVINGVKIKEFNISGNYVRGYKGNTQSYTDFLLESDFDIIMNYAAQQWTTDLILPILQKIKGKKVLVPCGYSGLNNINYAEYFEKLKDWIHQYDCTVYLSSDYQDIKFARDNFQKNIIIIPNGADENEFLNSSKLDIRKLLNIPSDAFLILTIGSHTGVKGHYETIKIFNKSRIRNAYLIVVGNYVKGGCYKRCKIHGVLSNLLPLNLYLRKKVKLVTKSRSETVELLKQADLFLFTSNIECSPIVLFEAMASSTPFIVTDVGNSREIISWSGGGLLLPTKVKSDGLSYAIINESVRILEKMYTNESLRQKLLISGYNAWKNNFTWKKISEKYEELYRHLQQNNIK